LTTQVAVGVEEGLKLESSIHCDALMSIPKTALTHYVGSLSREKLQEVDEALKIALSLDE
jgi:mRNA interferase MazF